MKLLNLLRSKYHKTAIYFCFLGYLILPLSLLLLTMVPKAGASELVSVAVFPFAVEGGDKYKPIGWGMQSMLSSRLQNVPGIYCLHAQDVVNCCYASPATHIGGETHQNVLSRLQNRIRNTDIDSLYDTLGVDILIYGKIYPDQDMQKIKYMVFCGTEAQHTCDKAIEHPDDGLVSFLKSEKSVFHFSIEKVARLIYWAATKKLHKKNAALKSFITELKSSNDIFSGLPRTTMAQLIRGGSFYETFRTYGLIWNNFAGAIREGKYCPTWDDYIRLKTQKLRIQRSKKYREKKAIEAQGRQSDELQKLISEITDEMKLLKSVKNKISKDARILDGWIRLHNGHFAPLSRSDTISGMNEFEAGYGDKPRLIDAYLIQIQRLWEQLNTGNMFDKSKDALGIVKDHPIAEIYQAAFEAANKTKQDEQRNEPKSIVTLNNIANRASWLTRGFDNPEIWAVAVYSKFLLDLGRVGDLIKYLQTQRIDMYSQKSAVISYLLGEMYFRNEEYRTAHLNYKRAYDELKKNDTAVPQWQALSFFHPLLGSVDGAGNPIFLTGKIQQCLHKMDTKRLAGGGDFLKLIKKHVTENAIVEKIHVIAQNNAGVLFAATDQNNVYPLISDMEKLPAPMIQGAYFENAFKKAIASLDQKLKQRFQIKQMQFDSDGNLWIRAFAGLVRLRREYIDAYLNNHIFKDKDSNSSDSQEKSINTDQFDVYLQAESDSFGEKGLDNLNSFYIDASDNFWLASPDSGVELCKCEEDNFKCQNVKDIKAQTSYNTIQADRDGNVFVSTEDGIYRLASEQPPKFNSIFTTKDFGGELIRRFVPVDPHDGGQSEKKHIIFVLTDPGKGNAWSAPNLWLMQFDNSEPAKGTILEKYTLPLSNDRIGKILADKQDGLWLCTNRQGVMITRQYRSFSYDGFLISGEHVFDLMWDREGLLWMATSYGLRRFNFETVTMYDQYNGLPGSKIYALASGDNGNLYVGTSGGLATPQKGVFERYSDVDKYEIRGICEDRSGNVWLRSSKWVSFCKPGFFKSILPGQREFLDEAAKKITIDETTDHNTVPKNMAYDAGRDGIWTNTATGICFISTKEIPKNKNDINFFKLFDGSGYHPTTPALDHEDGTVWFAKKNRLFFLDKNTVATWLQKPTNNQKARRTIQPYDSIDELAVIEALTQNSEYSRSSVGDFYIKQILIKHAKAEKELWLGTSFGVILYLPDSKTFTLLNDSLFGAGKGPVTVNAMMDYKHDEDDTIWIGTDRGLFWYHPRYQVATLFNHQYGFRNTCVNSIAAVDGRIWAGTELGLATFGLNPVAPIVLHTEAALDDDRNVRVHVNTSFFRESRQDLRYLLTEEKTGRKYIVTKNSCRPLDGNPVKADFELNGGSLLLKGLNPGPHTYQIQAMGREFNPGKASIINSIEIPYPFWMRWWFYSVLAGLVMMITFIAYLNTQHAKDRIWVWLAIRMNGYRMNRYRSQLLHLIYLIFQSGFDTGQILLGVREQTNIGKIDPYAGLINNYRILFREPHAIFKLADLLEKNTGIDESKNTMQWYRILSQMIRKPQLNTITGLGLEYAFNEQKLSLNASKSFRPPDFIVPGAIELVIQIDKSMSILSFLKNETDMRNRWYYLTAADRILRDVKTNAERMVRLPEKRVIICIAEQYLDLIQKEINRVVAHGSNIENAIEGAQIHHIIKKDFPSPIACMFAKVQMEDNPVIKSDLASDLLSILLRSLCFMVLSDYVSMSTQIKTINLMDFSKMPMTEGRWRNMLIDIVSLIQKSNVTPSIPDIYEVFTNVKNAQMLVDLVALRNKIVHKRQRDIETVNVFNEKMTRLLDRISFLKDIDLMVVNRVIEKSGGFQKIKFLCAKGSFQPPYPMVVTMDIDLPVHHVFYNNSITKRIIDLHPFILYDLCSRCGEYHLFFFMDARNEKASYLSATTNCILERKDCKQLIEKIFRNNFSGKLWAQYNVFNRESDKSNHHTRILNF